MSKKILIDEAILIRAISAMGLCFEFLSNLGSVFANDVHLTTHDLKKVIEESKKHRFSVLEWHPVSEKPKDESTVLVKFHDDFIFSGVVCVDDDGWCCYGCTRDQIKEWAYLPSEEGNEQTSN